MTQKELIKVASFVNTIRSIAFRLESEGNSYDCKWHKEYVTDILGEVEKMHKLLYKKK